MQFYLAPMEGITTYIFRRNFNKYFGGIQRYYTPFLASMHLSRQETNEVLPENNEGMTLVPQILSNKADEFIEITKTLKNYGYTEVNLNLGCPSQTVTTKHRGAGFLSVLPELACFLDEIFEKCEMDISVKTRIGIREESEWEDILSLYEKYPLKELIIHTRLQKDFYKLPTRPHTFLRAKERLHTKLCYNGDIFSKADLDKVIKLDLDIQNVMLGRGLIANPNLIREIKGENFVSKEVIGAFMEELLLDYQTNMSGGERVLLYKMKEIWCYLGASFTNSEKYLKRIKKASYLTDYRIAVRDLLSEQELIGL